MGQTADALCDPGDGVQFDDMAATDYAAGYIICARALGLTKGRADGSYGPDLNLTRSQMAAFLARLWRDVLGRDCPAGSHPFTDVPYSHYASADIGCLYLLKITKGASPDAYAPSATLTVSQLTRFLIRMVNKITPGSCDTSGNELAKAAACMAVLHIAPSAAEAESSSKATRAQMAVYLIGAWHHAARPGVPPKPPTRPTDAATTPTSTTTTIPGESTAILPVVSAGGSHSCGVRTDGTAVCWGNAGDDRTEAPSGTFTDIATGYAHSCGVRSDRSVVCWGKNQHGQTDAPEGAFKTVTAGNHHSCGLRTDKTLKCWGYNQAGRAAPPPREFESVSAGTAHTCGVRADRTLACWGDNSRGQSTVPEGEFAPVSADGLHTCGVRADRTLACWGQNHQGQANAPKGEFTDVSAGGAHTCAVAVAGAITCWGTGWPTKAPGGTFRSVSSGDTHSCGVTTGEAVACWGSDSYGQANAPIGWQTSQ